MQFQTTTLDDAWLIHLEHARDSRGFFARTFCVEEFAAHGLETNYPQHSISFSARKGTVRGMHYQRKPHGEVKLVRCLNGAIWDVIIDIRPEFPDLPPLAGLRALEHQRMPALHSEGICARLPDPQRRRRGQLPDFGTLCF